MEVAITPQDGAKGVRPDLPVKVKVVNGSLQEVSVATGGRPVKGDLDAVNSQWASKQPLEPSTTYKVTATAVGGDGKTVTSTSGFTTLKPSRTIRTVAVAPSDGETVGIGMPIILKFDQPVYNQAEVEKALEVKAGGRPVEGAWRWVGRTEIVYRTRKAWPTHTKVAFNGRLSGVRMAKGVYGTRDISLRFKIGDAHVSVAGEDTHTMVVKNNGKVVKRLPISMGNGQRPSFVTTNGTHVTMEKLAKVTADSATVGIPKTDKEYYKMDLEWTVRISDSGEYTHSAPWSVGAQGNSNVSHGCINLSAANAKWFYDFSQRGDIVKVTGTTRELEWDNGWGYWQLPWNQWKKGSSLPG